MKQAKDFLNNPINVGDVVVFAAKHYKKLRKGIISKITDKMVFIEDIETDYKTPYFELHGKKYFSKPTRQFHYQIVKIK